jgi:hypothetical protein
MLMKARTIILGSMLSLIIVGCSKTSPLLENQKDYIGKWKNDSSTLIIEKDGDAKYSQHLKAETKTTSSDISTSSLSNIKAPITALDAQHIQIGEGSMSKEFKVDKPPFEQDGKWKVILDGQVYTRN